MNFLRISGIAILFTMLISSNAMCEVVISVGDIIVSDSINGNIIRVDPTTGQQSILAQTNTLNQSVGFDFDASGNLFYSTRLEGLVKVNLANGNKAVIAGPSNFASPFVTTVAPNGDIIVTDADGGPGGAGRLFRVDPSSGVATEITSGSIPPGDLANTIVDTNGDFIVANGNTQILKIDAVTGNHTVISQGGQLFRPFGVAIDSSGDIIVTASGNDGNTGNDVILSIDPITGAQTAIPNTLGAFNDVRGITIDENGDFIVFDNGGVEGVASSLIRVNRINGQQTVISSGNLLGSTLDDPIISTFTIVVPEPSTFIAMILALTFLGLFAKKK